MAAVATSFLGYSLKVVIFAVIAYAGIVCGKKYRDYKADKLKEIISEAVDSQKDK